MASTYILIGKYQFKLDVEHDLKNIYDGARTTKEDAEHTSRILRIRENSEKKD
jgi:hypothetical protein